MTPSQKNKSWILKQVNTVLTIREYTGSADHGYVICIANSLTEIFNLHDGLYLIMQCILKKNYKKNEDIKFSAHDAFLE
jgi:hypothetical protein